MNAPPRLAVMTLRRVCSSEVRPEVEGDLMEAFEGWVASRGTTFARRRYWKEVVFLAGWRGLAAWRGLTEGGGRGRSRLGGSGTGGTPTGLKPPNGLSLGDGGGGRIADLYSRRLRLFLLFLLCQGRRIKRHRCQAKGEKMFHGFVPSFFEPASRGGLVSRPG